MIRAFGPLFHEAADPVRLVLVGGSSFTDGYVASLHELAGADPRVVLAGYVFGPALAELYSNAAVFVQPSALEGLPLTLLEAAAYRVPVVASDIAPHREVLHRPGPGARLFGSGRVEELSRALAVVLRDLPIERAGARLVGDDVRRRYDWDAAAEATESLYRSLLGRPGDRELVRDGVRP